jgi:hypothetical protein
VPLLRFGHLPFRRREALVAVWAPPVLSSVPPAISPTGGAAVTLYLAEGGVYPMKAPVVRDDRILAETRLLGGVVVPVLVAAAIMLYFFPDRTTQLFAWTIEPRMSALLMGGGYAAGAYYFARVVVSRQWHHVGTYFLAIGTFTAVLGLTTILHWGQFNHHHVSFYAWVLLYFTTPFLIPLVWLRNRRTDPGTPDADDIVVPQGVRVASAIAGATLLLLAASMFLVPAAIIPAWPWQLYPATCRAIGGWPSAPGVCYLLFAFEPRWSAWRIILQHQAIAVGLILLAVARAWDEFNPAAPATWLYVGGMAIFLIATIGLLLFTDSRRPKAKQLASVAAAPAYSQVGKRSS